VRPSIRPARPTGQAAADRSRPARSRPAHNNDTQSLTDGLAPRAAWGVRRRGTDVVIAFPCERQLEIVATRRHLSIARRRIGRAEAIHDRGRVGALDEHQKCWLSVKRWLPSRKASAIASALRRAQRAGGRLDLSRESWNQVRRACRGWSWRGPACSRLQAAGRDEHQTVSPTVSRTQQF
jgi:hypothetical protein